VIYRLGSLGDTGRGASCFHKVAQTWPNAERIVLTNFRSARKRLRWRSFLREGGLIQAAIAYPSALGPSTNCGA